MALPTGAMGNLTAGYMVKQMGIPFGNLCAGVNINGECRFMICRLERSKSLINRCLTDITNRVIETGEFHKKKIQKTLSDAINIEVVSTSHYKRCQCTLVTSNMILLIVYVAI